jgi:hypothetical protein
MTLEAKNVWTQDLVMKSLGTTLYMGVKYDLTANCPDECMRSHALKYFVREAYVEIYEDSVLLSIEDAIAALTLEYGESQETTISVGTNPPDNPSHGKIWSNPQNVISYAYDENRGIWMSTPFALSFSLSGSCKNKYLDGPSQYSNTDGGYRCIRDLVIRGVKIDIYLNNNSTSCGITPEIDYTALSGNPEFVINDDSGWRTYSDSTLNIPLNEDDQLQMYCWSNKNVKDCHVVLDVAWRYAT